jgi:Zn-dependent protease
MMSDIAVQMATAGIFLNFILATFNLVPIPPLDGSHVLAHFLPPRLQARFRSVGRYGLGILLLAAFLVPGAVETLLWPAYTLTDAAFAIVEWLV